MLIKKILVLLLAVAATSSHAWWSSPEGASARLEDSVVSDGLVWTYSYKLVNTDSCFGGCSTLLGKSILGYWLGDKDFAVPYFADADIHEIKDGDGWTHFIDGANLFSLPGAKTLIWTASTEQAYIAAYSSLGGFGYKTVFEPGKGPFSALNGGNERYFGDSAIPLSPMAIAAGISAVPEQQTLVLMLAGLGLTSLVARRRKTL